MMTAQQIQAIYTLYPQVTATEGLKAFDADGNEVVYDIDAVDAYISSNAYKELRAKEYPPITDYIDGVVKGDQAQIQAYIDACLAVKAKYPKGN
jgi:uncharacterized protein (UPF0297 family)